jgi:homogentisate 1,2-dioxygenase
MIPYIRGVVAKQAHVGVPEGTYEEEFARNGFFGRYAHLYRRRPPVDWVEIDGPLKPRSYDLNEAMQPAAGEDYVRIRKPVLENDDVRLHCFGLSQPMPYFFRNADADEVFFIHAGHGRMETDFGPVDYVPGDYVVVPRGTTYRLAPADLTRILLIESFSEIRLPEKGMLGQHALFDPAVIQVPTPEPIANAGPGRFEVRIQRCDEVSRVVYPTHPLDVAGWKGTLTVWQLNVNDIRPVSSDRYHLPPSAHTTFVADRFVVCTFLPRPLENGDPSAMKVPFYHLNIDFDEVLFYHQGQFFSRTGVGVGMLTFHPQGIHHGPQPGAAERTNGIKETNEIAVMIDTKRPLRPTIHAEGFENKDYWKSWKESK